MSKPDWKDAPKWANYLAMDADGEWYWYESQPHADQRAPGVRGAWYEYTGKFELARIRGDWISSLETRPE